jgi:hypothetical protein
MKINEGVVRPRCPAGSEHRVWKLPRVEARGGLASANEGRILISFRFHFAVSAAARVGAEAPARPRAHHNRKTSRTPTTSA